MADLSNFTLDGTPYDFKDAVSRARYGTCTTGASTATKAVTCNGFKLETGAFVNVKFTVTNTSAVSGLKLNVNSTGEKAIKYRGGNLPSADTLSANRVYSFVYDGTNYELIGDTGCVNADQGSANAGKFLVVGNDGIVAPVAMTAWAGGDY